LAAKGANIVVNFASDSSKEKARKVTQELHSEYRVKVVLAQADLATIDGPKKLIEIARSHFINTDGVLSTSSSTMPGSAIRKHWRA
jgi:3-oxoacyl-[acyl-carrier protein] reductase